MLDTPDRKSAHGTPHMLHLGTPPHQPIDLPSAIAASLCPDQLPKCVPTDSRFNCLPTLQDWMKARINISISGKWEAFNAESSFAG